MRISLLSILFAFSLNAFAQTQHSPSSLKDPRSNSIHNSIREHHHAQSSFEILPITQQQTLVNCPSREVLDLVVRLDSIYYWGWDSLNLSWTIESKFVDILYNSDIFPTSYTGQIWNGSSWLNSIQIIYTYDSNNNETGYLYKFWNGTAWLNLFQTLYTYDGNNNGITEVDQMWTGISWENSDQYLYTYDANNNETSETDQEWDGTTWVNYDHYTYTYNGNNDETSDLYQSWDDVNEVWVNSDQSLYTYDANHNVLTDTFQVWNALSWRDVFLTTYTYDGNNNMLTQLSQNWDGTTWVNSDKTNYTYSGHNILNGLRQHWNFGSWHNASRVTYTHNGNNMTGGILYEMWDDSIWLHSTESFSSYDENDFVLGQGNRSYDDAGDLIIEGDSAHYYFKTLAGTKDFSSVDGTMTVYPNPSDGKFTITDAAHLGNIEIYNSIGVRVYSAKNIDSRTTSEINLTGNAKGVYMLVMKDGNRVSCRKILIQ